MDAQVSQAYIISENAVGRFYTENSKLLGVLQQGIGFTAEAATAGNVSSGGGTVSGTTGGSEGGTSY